MSIYPDIVVAKLYNSYSTTHIKTITSMRVTCTIVKVTAQLARASAHFSFVDIKSQIACDFVALDGINWLAKPICKIVLICDD